MDERKVAERVSNLKNMWARRNDKFKEWYKILILVDQLYTAGMESYVSNEPQTFYNMAHYLLTKGEIVHSTPISAETAIELDRRAKINRGCEYAWRLIDKDRLRGGSQSFVDELSFFLLVLGWYSVMASFDSKTGNLFAQVWSPADTYPRFTNGNMVECVHSYNLSVEEAVSKAEENGWNFKPRNTIGTAVLDNYFYQDTDGMHNIILINSKDITGDILRTNLAILSAPVGGFPDRGSLTPQGEYWQKLAGRGIFEVNQSVSLRINKWKSMVTQILRDTAQPVTQEFSATPQATVEQLRERGALFHYGQGEKGLVRVEAPEVPNSLLAGMADSRREIQKGSFNDAVYGMMEGQSGYALSLLSTSSANQILYPYMDAKHFVIGECDRFWLSNLKTSKHVFEIKGKFIEKLKPSDIPDNVYIEVESDVATPKDWMERATAANMLKDHLDSTTINSEVLKISDTQGVKRRRSLDKVMDDEMTLRLEQVSIYKKHAAYLRSIGDAEQAAIFEEGADALRTRLGIPPAGSGSPLDSARIKQQIEEGTPDARTKVASNLQPPEMGGFSPAQLRQSIGKGTLRGR